MGNVYALHTEAQIEEEASLWVARLDRGLSEEETAQLRDWLALSPAHRAMFLEMAHLCDRMDSLTVLSELFDAPSSAPRVRFARVAGWAVAACFVLAMVAGPLLNSFAPQRWMESGSGTVSQAGPDDVVYETGVGAHSTVSLPDGTRLRLNTNTRVEVTYTVEERLLDLRQGEIHVEVAHNPDRPLRVRAAGQVVEAVGTAFNVYLKDDDNFDVIVTEGRVRVKPLDVPGASSGLASPMPRELIQGQKLAIRARQATVVEQMDSAKINDELSWRDGTLVFRGETLREALDEVSRYTSARFEITDPAIADVRIAGLYKAGDVDGLLLALKENFNIEHQRDHHNTIRLSRQENLQTDKPDQG
ncbi:FecR family protein [Marinimicrobium sp. ARAG 43.8]|uniref:FecR family protein n=1 Tax=Marinimicrobium sp. ARAG 43.8 TaxID=3418719 RepID=UPI003CF48921